MRRLEDKILNLYRLILATKDGDQLDALLVELRGAMHQHIERIRARLAEYPIVTERRDHNRVLQPGIPPAENAAK
jgi:hypothetical protein